MSLNPDQSTFAQKERKLVPAGQQIARNYAIVDLGTQTEQFQNNPPKDVPKVMFLFEFPEHKHTYDEKVGPETLTVSQEYTFIASDRSKLPKVLQAWGSLKSLPTSLNLKPYLGQYCMLMIEHAAKKSDPRVMYANIMDGGRSVSPIPQIMRTQLPAASRKNIFFNLDEFSWDLYNQLPKYVKEKIAKCKEWPTILAKFPAPVQQAQATIPNQPAQQAGGFGLPSAAELDGGPSF